ncbi:MAG TPA: type 2 lanthipeptide synthetase LanM family protein [Rhizomicrobium sp.]|nr:type 2 lanthipeptide synthetase LanM family protein [Rhizomicrobium sp.]
MLEQWQRQLGGAPALARRLAWASLDESRVLDALARQKPVAEGEEPGWLSVVAAVMSQARNPRADRTLDPLRESVAMPSTDDGASDPLPFEDLLRPALHVAREQLRHGLALLRRHFDGDLTSLIAISAYATAERTLLSRLSKLSERTFGLEFANVRPPVHALMGLLPGFAEHAPRECYNRWVDDMLRQGLMPIFEAYPVLARLIAVVIENWSAEFAQFAARLACDRDEIATTLADGAELGPVVALTEDCSDPHRGGHSVRIVCFATGKRLVYKPRSVALELGLDRMLAWCNAAGAPLALLRIRHLDRGDYGWALDCVQAAPCEDARAVERFYRRAGMLLCLAHILEANDLHSENLIAAGEHPVIVDAETFLHPRLSSAAVADEDAAIAADSVLRTGMLPRWSFGGEAGMAYDVSALGRTAQDSPWPAMRWEAVNTDYMTLVPRRTVLLPADNAPVLNGAAVSAADYTDAICGGFADLYRLIASRRDELAGEISPLRVFRDRSARLLFRPTEIYGAVLASASLPQALTDGAAHSIALESMARIFLEAEMPPPAWPLLRAEIDALERLDIPYFEISTSSRSIRKESGGIVDNLFVKSGIDAVMEKMSKLGDADMEFQIMLIRGSFLAQIIRPAQPAAAGAETILQGPLPTTADFLARAEEIARSIAARAIDNGNGCVGWLGIRYAAQARCHQFEPIGPDLYDGRCGIALFLAALDHARGTASFRALTIRALQPVQRLVRDGRATALGLGGATGIGAIVYALTRIGAWIGEESLLDSATAAAMQSAAISEDDRFDVIGGAAGGILGMLALYEATGNPMVLDRARVFADHLLAHRIACGEGSAWRTIAEKPLTGFSHGAAGIAYALQRLYGVMGEARYRRAAEEAIAFEQSCYCDVARNWPDFRLTDPAFAMSWCHGAPGIGLARLGGLPVCGNDAGIENALAAAQAAALHEVDHLCCGNLGVAETLLVGGLRLHRPSLIEAARRRAARVLARADDEGGYRLFANVAGDLYHPGLFQGVAGVGYGLLRLAAPERVPSLLLWE